MDNETVHRNIKREKRSNTNAVVGFLLTLFNIAVSIILLVTENTATCLIFSAVTAFISLIICSCGASNANRAGKGKAISVIGIILNVLILIAVVLFLIIVILFAQACAGIFEGIFQR